MVIGEAFYKAYELTERRFPSKKKPVMDYYIDILLKTDRQKANFLRLLVMELVPDDLRPDGDYNTPRIEKALKELDLAALEQLQDGSGDFMLGVLYARGIRCFPNRNVSQAELKKALECFGRAKEKGCPIAEDEIKYYASRME